NDFVRDGIIWEVHVVRGSLLLMISYIAIDQCSTSFIIVYNITLVMLSF
ncbi:hypothetical protein C5S53_07100, partial [Methanophagales archaeon]